jgi:hypothetical protein
MNVEQLLRDPPALHLDGDGNALPWAASPRLLRALSEQLFPGAKTLETGAGVSTLVFALHGCEHTVVVPDAAIAGRITAWCNANGVSTATLAFEIERSETALARMEPSPLDTVLIDGGHGFPVPFIDWYLAGQRLKPGGFLFIDDIHIWTGAVLQSFLRSEPGWEVLRGAWMEYGVARRTEPQPTGEFYRQPYVSRRTFMSASPSPRHRLVGVARETLFAGRAAARLIRSGDFSSLRSKIAARTTR